MWHGYSNEDSATCWADTETEAVTATQGYDDAYESGSFYETITVSDTIATDQATVTSTITETVTVSDFVLDSQTLKTDYAYYLGDSIGKVYEYSGSYKSDNGVAIGAYYQTKRLDFADQFPQLLGMWKTVGKVRLDYVDKSANINVTVYLSTDGGANWTSQMKTFGTGDGTTKSEDFYFLETGQYFSFKVENSSTSETFQWLGLRPHIVPAGTHEDLA